MVPLKEIPLVQRRAKELKHKPQDRIIPLTVLIIVKCARSVGDLESFGAFPVFDDRVSTFDLNMQ